MLQVLIGGPEVAECCVGVRAGFVNIVEIRFRVAFVPEQSDQSLDRCERLGVFVRGFVDRQLHFGQVDIGEVTAVSGLDLFEQGFGLGDLVGLEKQEHFLYFQRPDILRQGDAGLPLFDRLCGFGIASQIHQHGREFRIEVRELEFVEPVLDHEVDCLAVVFHRCLFQPPCAVDVPELFVCIGGCGLVVVPFGLRHILLQLVLGERVLRLLGIIEDQPRPCEVIIFELVVLAGEILHAGNPCLERIEVVVEIVMVGFHAQRNGLHPDVVLLAREPEQRVRLAEDGRVAYVVVTPAVIGVKRTVNLLVAFVFSMGCNEEHTEQHRQE